MDSEDETRELLLLWSRSYPRPINPQCELSETYTGIMETTCPNVLVITLGSTGNFNFDLWNHAY